MCKNNTPKSQRRCEARGCGNQVGRSGAKGYCPRHYRRFVKYGDALVVRPEDYVGTWPKCSVDGCVKPARNRSADLCKMHYHRAYRSGDVGDAGERIRKQRAGKCAVDVCDNPDDEGIYCGKHAARFRRHGDPLKVLEPYEIVRPTGPDNWNWKEEPGYTAAHDRVRRARGSASDHRCVDCGDSAYHWSYNHDCDEEITRLVRGYYISYSPNIDQYSPRCVPCHKRYDLGRNDSVLSAQEV